MSNKYRGESQRDYASKPRVARHELRWENVVRRLPTPTGLRPVRRARGHNPVGVVDFFLACTQGSSFLATLGWRTQSLWDWKMRIRSRPDTTASLRACSQ